MEGKEVIEIDRAVERMTKALKGAIERHVPKIRSRTLLLPEIDSETKNIMEEPSRIKIFLAMNINYIENRMRLTSLREIIRER